MLENEVKHVDLLFVGSQQPTEMEASWNRIKKELLESSKTPDNKSSFQFPEFEEAFGHICQKGSRYWGLQCHNFQKFYNIVVGNKKH